MHNNSLHLTEDFENLNVLSGVMSLEEAIYKIADELRSIASSGLFFSNDPYDRERYEKALALSARLIASLGKSVV